jgi:hypothetical protein
MATDLLPSQVVLISTNRLISTPSVHYVFEDEEVPSGLPVDKLLFVDLDNNGSVKSYHAASKVNQIYSAQMSSHGNERVLQIEGNFVARYGISISYQPQNFLSKEVADHFSIS